MSRHATVCLFLSFALLFLCISLAYSCFSLFPYNHHHVFQIKASQEAQSKDFPDGLPECGADALRFGLLSYTVQGRDVNLDISRVVGYRQFCNKMWNAVRFALTYVSDFKPSPTLASEIPSIEGVSQRDLFILHRLNQTIEDIDINMKAYLFGNVTSALHSFFLYDVCDVYLELVKPVFFDTDTSDAACKRKWAAQATLYTVLEQYLRLCHPIMPFVTEELWQRLPNMLLLESTESIMLAAYPKSVAAWHNPVVQSQMDLAKECINNARSMRTQYSIANHVKTNFYFRTENVDIRGLLEAQADDFCTLCRGNFFVAEDNDTPKACSIKVVNDELSILVDLTGIVDWDQEITRLTKDMEKLLPLTESLHRKIVSPGYDKVPDAVKEQNTQKLSQYSTEMQNLQNAIAEFENLRK